MTRAIDWTSWVLWVVTGACIFLGGTAIHDPDALPNLFGTLSPQFTRLPIAEVVKRTQGESLEAMTEQELWSAETMAQFDGATQ